MKKFLITLMLILLLLFDFALIFLTAKLFFAPLLTFLLAVASAFLLIFACDIIDRLLGYGKYNKQNKS